MGGQMHPIRLSSAPRKNDEQGERNKELPIKHRTAFVLDRDRVRN